MIKLFCKFVLPVIFFFSLCTLKSQNPHWIFYNMGNSGLPTNDITSIAIDNDGNKWFGALDNLDYYAVIAKFDNINWTVYWDHPTVFRITEIAFDAAGNKWFATHGGVEKLDKDENWTVYNSSNSGLPNDLVSSVVIDAQGNKWFGTMGGGVAKFDDVNWSIYNTSNSGLPYNYVNSIAMDAEGNKWIGTGAQNVGSGGLAKFDDVNWTIYKSYNSGLPHNHITKVAIDQLDNKWIGTIAGLAKFDDSNWTVYSTSNSELPGDYIYSLAIDGDGNKWIGTFEGLAKFDDSSWTIYNISNSKLPTDAINSIAFDLLGNKWFGTTDYGLIVFNESGLVGINNYSQNVEIKVYPNPAYDFINVEGSQAGMVVTDPARIVLTDVQGKTILEQNITQTSTRLDIHLLPPGIYLLQIHFKDTIRQEKIIIK